MKNNITLNSEVCIVDINSQAMFVRCKNFEKKYLISSGKNGTGNEEHSFKTPLGKHSICEKIGENVPIYTVFKSRKNTGIQCEQLNIETNEDLILTRILRLKGEELGVNVGTKNGKCIDSYQRYIYIHGTNREDLIGEPASNGCIRMNNIDIIELFSKVSVGTIVDIR